MPSSSVLDRILSTILDLAEQQLQDEGRVAPVLILAGPYGEALIRLEGDPGEDRDETLDKAALMAIAFAAEACAWVFETTLWTPAGISRVIAATGQHLEGAATALVEIGADGQLDRITSPLESTIDADGPSRLASLLRDDGSTESQSLEAWRQLEAMGVSLSDARRPIH